MHKEREFLGQSDSYVAVIRRTARYSTARQAPPMFRQPSTISAAPTTVLLQIDVHASISDARTTAMPADGRAHCVDDHCVGHGVLLVSGVKCQVSSFKCQAKCTGRDT